MRLIQAGDLTAYPGPPRFVIATTDAAMLIADASCPENAALSPRQIRPGTFAREHGISSPALRPGPTLPGYLNAGVSGRDFAHGKPAPEIFLSRARTRRRAPPRDRDHGRLRRNPTRQSRRHGRARRRTSRRRRPARHGRRRSRSPPPATSAPPPSPEEGWPPERHYAARQRHHAGTGLRSGGRRSRLRPRQHAQIDPLGVVPKVMRTAYHNVPNGGSRGAGGRRPCGRP